jgi:uncharacterized protein YbjT (DUF2867 family)
VRALADREERVRALVFREEAFETMRRLGASEVVAADMRDPEALRVAASGVGTIYHICPNVHPDEVAIGESAIAAARSAGVERFVYHSVLLPAVEAMPHHWLKHGVERRLRDSGLQFRGVLGVPYGTDVEMSLVDLEDVAEAAAVVLTSPGHEGATYELCGPEAIAVTGIADSLERQLGRPVRAEFEEVEDWERTAGATGLGEYQVDALVRMFRYYDRNDFTGSSEALRRLLGRQPTSFEEFAARTVESRSRAT